MNDQKTLKEIAAEFVDTRPAEVAFDHDSQGILDDLFERGFEVEAKCIWDAVHKRGTILGTVTAAEGCSADEAELEVRDLLKEYADLDPHIVRAIFTRTMCPATLGVEVYFAY